MERISTGLLAFLALVVFATESASANPQSEANNNHTHKHTIISRDVIVQDGDTLISIASRELGKSGLAPLLSDYNNLKPNAQLVPGSIVRVPIQVPPRDEYAEVVFVKGTVTATRFLEMGARAQIVSASHSSDVMSVAGGNREAVVIELSRNAKVFPGDLITTSIDGYASIAFSSGSVINMQPDTIASLERLTCMASDDSCLIEVNTRRGRVTSDVESRDQQPADFRITTPYASAAVRGTVFDVDASEQMIVGVTEGVVDISAQNETVALNTGFGLLVSEGAPPGEPIELIPGPVFKRVPARIVSGDTIEWWPFVDAASYLAVLSTDESANETLFSFSLPRDSAVFDLQPALEEPVDVGDYFLTLRAIDSNGLLGFTSNTRITLAEVDSTIQPVTTTVVREGSEFVVAIESVPDEALGFEIQISSDEAFSDPLSVDVNTTGTAVFRVNEDRIFSRARVLLDPFTVSAFGEPSGS
ncbi:MAG: FecR domain-containing protein [Granulosicoccus sp.]